MGFGLHKIWLGKNGDGLLFSSTMEHETFNYLATLRKKQQRVIDPARNNSRHACECAD
jgi:hypothetical protein